MKATRFPNSGSRFRSVINFLALLVFLLFPGRSTAEIYLEFGYDFGGDTLASTSLDDLNAGSGIKLAVGLKRFIGGFDDVGLIFSVGFLVDSIEASNGDAETDATVLELIYFRDFGPHRIGVGGSFHMNPSYEDNVVGFARTRINFDDALGVMARYGYLVGEQVEFGIRYTVLDYEFGGVSVDAGGIGLFLSGSF